MEIVTQRLVLRELRESDLEAVVALYSDPLFRRYQGSPMNKAEVGPELQDVLERAHREPRDHYNLAVTIAPDDRLCGYIHLKENNRSIREWEIGWGMHTALWGRVTQRKRRGECCALRSAS